MALFNVLLRHFNYKKFANTPAWLIKDPGSSTSAIYSPAQIDSHEIWLSCPWEICTFLVDLAVMADSYQTKK